MNPADPEKVESGSGLADALFPYVRQRVLALLFGQPGRGFTISEIIRLAGTGSGAVQREVKRMAQTGLLEVSREHRQKEYRANPDSPIYDELCSLVHKTLGPVERLRKAVLGLGDQVHLALLYGSMARGNERSDSDMDVLIVSDELTLEDVYKALQSVETDLARRVNPTLYSLDEFRRRQSQDNAFLGKVLSGKHVVLKDNSDGSLPAGQSGPNWSAQTRGS